MKPEITIRFTESEIGFIRAYCFDRLFSLDAYVHPSILRVVRIHQLGGLAS